MKKIEKLLMIIFLLIGTYAFIPFCIAKDDKTNIEQSYLIEKYLINHKENIISFSEKYHFQNDKKLLSYINRLDYLIQSLRALQNDWEKSWINISNILKEIKEINENIRILLIEKKHDYQLELDIKRENYQNLWKKLSEQLDKIYLKMYNNLLLNKWILTKKEENLKNSLKALNVLSKEIQYFWLKEFDTEEEMKTSFIGALNSIKYHITAIKNNMN